MVRSAGEVGCDGAIGRVKVVATRNAWVCSVANVLPSAIPPSLPCHHLLRNDGTVATGMEVRSRAGSRSCEPG